MNGGVLAIAQVAATDWSGLVLGLAMLAFTTIMGKDINAFGIRFHAINPRLYREQGRKVLAYIWLTPCLAWALLSFGAFSRALGLFELPGPGA